MACKTNLVTVLADAAVASFEAVLPALSAAGAISPTAQTALTNYVNTAIQTLDTVIAELKAGNATLSKIAAVVQTVVTAFDTLKPILPPGLFLYVNVANIAVQALLKAIEAEIGPAPAATASAEVLGVGHATIAIDSSVHTSSHHLNGLKNRLDKVRVSVMAHPVAAPAHA